VKRGRRELATRRNGGFSVVRDEKDLGGCEAAERGGSDHGGERGWVLYSERRKRRLGVRSLHGGDSGGESGSDREEGKRIKNGRRLSSAPSGLQARSKFRSSLSAGSWNGDLCGLL